MTCCVIGPGLVGSFLGALAGSRLAVAGPGGAVRARRVALAGTVHTWDPTLVDLAAAADSAPLLIATRTCDAPWNRLPADALAAQNGLGQPRPVATCFFALDLDAEGVLHCTGPRPRVVVGELPARWQPVLAAWRQGGLAVEVHADPRPAQWEKTILNATVGPLCLATGRGMDEVWADAGLRALVLRATREGIAIASACGIACVPGIEQRAAAFFATVGDHRPSILKHPGELPWVLGQLLRHARGRDLNCPALARILLLASRRPIAAADQLAPAAV